MAQQVEPFVSSEDIAKGTRGRDAITRELQDTSEGIVCITEQNLREPWLNFEAGALSKETGEASVRTVLLDLTPADVEGPLSDFQHTELNKKEDVRKFLYSVNERCERPLEKAIVDRVFDTNWPALEETLTRIRGDLTSEPGQEDDEDDVPTRSSKRMLGEVLERVRGIERLLKNPTFSTAVADDDSTANLLRIVRSIRTQSAESEQESRKTSSDSYQRPTVGIENRTQVEDSDHKPAAATARRLQQRMRANSVKGEDTRVFHRQHGAGTVISVTPAVEQATVQFDSNAEVDRVVETSDLKIGIPRPEKDDES